MQTIRRVLGATILALVAFACGKGDVTSPTTEQSTASESTVVSQPATPATPTVAATPDPGKPAAGRETPYVTLNTDGSGIFCNPQLHTATAYLTYTKPLDLSVIYGQYSISAEREKCVNIPPATQTIRKREWCGSLKVQVDVNKEGFLQGEHLGHVFATVEGDTNFFWKDLEVEITYSPWSEWSSCSKLENADAFPNCEVEKCYQTRTRTKTLIYKQENSCTKQIRERSRKSEVEKESRECPCPKPTPSPTPPPPQVKGYCHVSNKGNDHNINLEVNLVGAGLGHEKHLDTEKYCPIDYVVYGSTDIYAAGDEVQHSPSYSCTAKPGCSCTYPGYMPYAPGLAGKSILDTAKACAR